MIGWLRKLLRCLFPVAAEPRPRPADWNKTLTELGAENRSLSGEEISWAREYETEQLRSWVRFPCDGDIYVALQDVPVTFLIHWRAPYTTGGEGVLAAGTRLRVSVHAAYPEPVGVQAQPLNAQEVEHLLVPEADRLARHYDGYSVALPVALLNTDFRLIETDPPAAEVMNKSAGDGG